MLFSIEQMKNFSTRTMCPWLVLHLAYARVFDAHMDKMVLLLKLLWLLFMIIIFQ